jgi:hypothetical protein
MSTNFIDEVMNFDPTTITAYNSQESTSFNQNIYKTNPKDSKSEDGHYRCRVRILLNPNDPKQSIVKQATYAMKDADGFFMVKSKLGNGDRECPIFKAWKKLWFSNDETKKNWARENFNKTESQWCLVQILEDANRPELVGQIKVMKLPSAIYVKLEALQKPAPETKKIPVPVMDYVFGRVLEMDVTPGPDDPAHPERKQREIKYDLCTFENDPTPVIKVDGTPFFADEELELIEAYNNAKNDLVKAKTEKKKAESRQFLEDNQNAVRELYVKAVAYVKENAIDLVKECTYQEWDEKTSVRVQNWIDAVLDLRNPATESVSNVKTTETEDAAPAGADSDFFGGFDDLPL